MPDSQSDSTASSVAKSNKLPVYVQGKLVETGDVRIPGVIGQQSSSLDG